MKFLSLFLIVGLAGAIELPFETENGATGVQLSLGTPFQGPFRVGVDIQKKVTLQMGLNYYGGDYNSQTTSTWKYVGPDGTIGWFGTETFDLGGTVLNNIPFEVTKNTSLSKPPQYFGLGPNQTDTFLSGVLATTNDKTISIAFNNFPNTGVLTLGGLDSSRCGNNWQQMDEIVYTNLDGIKSWGVSATTLTIGNYVAQNPGNLTFNLHVNAPVRWPSYTYYSILTELETPDGITVSCQQTKNIVIQVGNVQLLLKPEEYLIPYAGSCTLTGVPIFSQNKEIVLPTSFLKHSCLSFNHETQKVGVVDLK